MTGIPVPDLSGNKISISLDGFIQLCFIQSEASLRALPLSSGERGGVNDSYDSKPSPPSPKRETRLYQQ